METSQTLSLLGCANVNPEIRERRIDTYIRSNPEDLKDVPPDATTAACTVKKEINQDNSHSVSTVGNNIYQGDNSLNPCGSARSSPARNVNESSSCETLDLITDSVYNNHEEEQYLTQASHRRYRNSP
ncbi:uncharacterized protein LOC142498679 isoform X2 [Ascaphus truei]|uniref:uncharacterized protein LOC142498679 isoform X2 n=1 Tax=Ascaphus truei TaxID=8439 RepID=UPI003F5A6157